MTGSYTHDLKKLIKIAGLQTNLETQILSDASFASNWATIKDWGPESRYRTFTDNEARDFIESITHNNTGILKWIKQYW